MTNEEMAKHLTDFDPKLYEIHKENAWPEDEADREKYEIALEMAEWKDEQAKESFKKFYDKGIELGKSIANQQFKEYLEKKKASIDNYAQAMMFSPFIGEIINELFKEN